MVRPLAAAVRSDPAPDRAPAWEAPACGLCGASDAEVVLEAPHAAAPDGRVAVVACTGCGLRRLTPRPVEDDAARHYADGYNAFVGRRRGRVKQVAWRVARDVAAGAGIARAASWLRPLARWAFDVVVPLDGATAPSVLEVGCGYGDLLLYLRARGCAVTGVDLDARAVAKARTYGLDVRQGPLRAVALPAASVDVCVLCHSLEHVADPLAELREIARVLRPGGMLHVAVPNGRAVGFALEGAAWEHASIPLHAWFFDVATVTALLDAAGYSLERPALVTSSYRPYARWLRELRTCGPRLATGTLLRWLRASRRTADGGDVVRVVARRR